jgi:hypothetical protein
MSELFDAISLCVVIDRRAKTALINASENGHTDVLEALLSHGTCVNIKDSVIIDELYSCRRFSRLFAILDCTDEGLCQWARDSFRDPFELQCSCTFKE